MNKPGKASVVKATSGKKVVAAASAAAEKFRPDLKDSAKRTAAAVQKSLRKRRAMKRKAASDALTVV